MGDYFFAGPRVVYTRSIMVKNPDVRLGFILRFMDRAAVAALP
jgi:hypothetical protein